MVFLYIAPGVVLEPHHHETEEIYHILGGEGTGYFGLGEPVKVEPGMFFHPPADAEHGIENTGDTMMKVLISSSPPQMIFPEWTPSTDH